MNDSMFIQIALSELRPDTPNWFGWADSKAAVSYANAVSIQDGVTKPTQEEFDAKFAELKSTHEFNANRRSAYPSIQEQLDMQYWDSVNGTTTWADAIAQVKSDYPKGGE